MVVILYADNDKHLSINDFPLPGQREDKGEGRGQKIPPISARKLMSQTAYFNILLALFLMFALKVAAQLIQAFDPVPFLPPFAAWNSGALPYPLLVLSQMLIMAVFLLTFGHFHYRAAQLCGGQSDA